MEWKKIEDMPPFATKEDEAGEEYYISYLLYIKEPKSNYGYMDVGTGIYEKDATHWMPLPPPPTE